MYIHENLDEGDAVSVAGACDLLEVSRSGYYDWCTRSRGARVSSRRMLDMALRDELQKIAVDFPRYGFRRMTVELRNRGFYVNGKRVIRLMREDNLLCVVRRFKPVTTDSDHNLKVFPNLARNMVVTGVNQLWVADITYIQLSTEFIFLAVILDVYSRRVIGWNLSRSLATDLALGALKMALRRRKNADLTRLVHHSDQGVQYASNAYVDLLKEHGINISMSRRGNPYDNAFAESFIKTLKYEEVYLNEYLTFQDAFENISKFIDAVYNKKRLHSGIGYKSPIQFEKEESSSIGA